MAENFQDILFSDYLLQWLELARCTIAETTYYGYKAIISRQICPYFASRKIKLHDLKPYHIQDFYAWTLKTRKVTGNTIHHYHANIHKALKHATQTELIQSNPASKVMLPKKERYRSDFYTVEEMNRLLEAIRGEKIEVPVYLACWYGMRRGEVLGLRWKDIDFETMTITVNGVVVDKGETTRTENMKYRAGGKTHMSVRSFPLVAEVAAFLQKQREKQERNKQLMGTMYCVGWEGFVCVDDGGHLIRPEYLSRTFPKVLKKHDFRPIRFHDLRGSNASLLLDKGVDMKLIQSWLGHAHYSTTADIYAHLRVEKKRDLASVLSAGLGV